MRAGAGGAGEGLVGWHRWSSVLVGPGGASGNNESSAHIYQTAGKFFFLLNGKTVSWSSIP